MNNRHLTIMLSAALAISWSAGAANPVHRDFTDYVNSLAERAITPAANHRLGSAHGSAPQRLVTKTDGTTPPVSNWSSIYTPDGEEWIYTADYEYEYIDGIESIKKANFTLYDSRMKVYKRFQAEFTLGENETSINAVQINPWLTKKFFNINDAYEVMVYVHATTVDYSGHNYNLVYTLSDGSLVTTIEGNNINAVNTSVDEWSENFSLMFMREEIQAPSDPEDYEGYKYLLYFDVYKKAGWGTGCTLEHTFEVDYSLVAGAGNAALPILVNKKGNKLFYALPRYEKPYFADSYSNEATPDNHFIIDLYDSSFNLVKTTSLPIELEEDALFSFPGLGTLSGNYDMDFTLFSNGDMPCYIIGMENYIGNTDDFRTSMYVYDTDGNRLKTIIRNADDYTSLADIDGFEQEWCFYHAEEDGLGSFTMVDLPSCAEVVKIPLALGDTNISTQIDRAASGDSFKYVSSILTAEADNHGNALHRLAWFNADGSFDRFTTINLGENIAMAQVYVSGEAFNPYIFNTDDKIEYMFLVKQYNNDGTTRSTEYLRIYNEDSDLLLELGPDAETGDVLNSIFLFNAESNCPKLITCYYGMGLYSVKYVDLPLSKFGGGDGTALNPYIIAVPGDLMSIATAPAAHYVIANDIDFQGHPWSGNNCEFTGSIEGNGHTISNLSLVDNGIFADINGGVSIRNINFKDVTLTKKSGEYAGVIANTFINGNVNANSLLNIIIDGLTVNCSNNASVGGFIGFAAVQTNIVRCSVTKASINAPNGVAGGFVGEISTGSTINASLFEGEVNALVAGGMIGRSIKGDEKVVNSHVNADIVADIYAGGIVGESMRTIVNNCFVEGSVAATGAKEVGAGGLVGRMEALYSDDKTIVLENNIVAAKVSVDKDATRAFAHRILGYSSGDELLVNWESTDPNVNWEDPSTYPYINGSPELMIANNYALGVAVVDETVADAHDSLEGKTVDALGADLLATLGFATGETVAMPWCRVDSKTLKLWYEEGASSGIVLPSTDAAIKYNGSAVLSQGAITVYDITGKIVATGNGSVATRHLPSGVYVAVGNAGTIKFAIR